MNTSDLFVRPPGSYLLSHSVGLPPVGAAQAALDAHVGVFHSDPAGAWNHWLAEIDGFRSALAALLGHDAAWFCPQTNVSSGLTKALQSLVVSGSVLMSEHAFPSLGFVADALRLAPTFVPADADVFDLDMWAARLSDPHVDTVVVTHVHSNTGEALPVGDIVALAREREVLAIVDVAQSVGVLPIDLTEWNADVVLGSCVKWLCGGPGAGWMWMRPGLVDMADPIDVGWFSHEDPFEFDIHSFRSAPDALRFWGGTPSVLPFAIARRSIELITSIGVDTVRAHNLALTDQLLAALPTEFVASPRDPARRSGTVVVHAGERTDAVLAALADAQVHVDRRPSGIRISPHLSTIRADIDRAASVITSTVS